MHIDYIAEEQYCYYLTYWVYNFLNGISLKGNVIAQLAYFETTGQHF